MRSAYNIHSKESNLMYLVQIIYIEINLKVENSRNKECIHFKQEREEIHNRLLGSSLLH